MTTATISKTIAPTFSRVIGKTFTVIDQAGLISGLLSLKGAKPITFVAQTEPDMRKTGNPYVGKVVKVAKVNGMVNFHYEEGVLRRLEKEGKSAEDFKQGTSWHEPVLSADGKLTPLCKHKTNGNQYLRFMLNGIIESEYREIETGDLVPNEKIEAFQTPKKSYGNQGLDEPLKFLTYGLDSIKAITVNGENYLVV